MRRRITLDLYLVKNYFKEDEEMWWGFIPTQSFKIPTSDKKYNLLKNWIYSDSMIEICGDEWVIFYRSENPEGLEIEIQHFNSMFN